MTLHPDSLPLMRHLKGICYELIDPLEESEWAFWEEGQDTVDGWATLRGGIFAIGGYFAAVDGDLSDDEAAMIWDVRSFFDPNDDEQDNIDPRQYRELLRQNLRDHPEILGVLQTPPAMFYLKAYDRARGTDLAEKARTMYFRFANAITKADGQITKEEQSALSRFKSILYEEEEVALQGGQEPHSPSQALVEKSEHLKDLDQLLIELDSLVGLGRVKTEVTQLVNFLKVQQIRQSKGLETQPISRHLVFYGNPGTGKTTVARLLGQIYRALGILSKGHLIETDRSGLVAGYVGQTALKVQDVVQNALGGILFIDEAYSLNASMGQDFGQEAIDTLIKLMEDNRDDLIVIVAGYTDKMNSFLSSNPGLRSRFNKYLNFEDYAPSQLVQIFELFCKNAGYEICQPTKENLTRLFSVLYETRDEAFGNGRLARNLFEMTISNQANRIVLLTDINEATLSTITEGDIPGMADLQTIA